MLELNKIYNMDCMEGMEQIPEKYFELAIVDPPYGIGINHNMGRRKGDKSSSYKKVSWDNNPPVAYYFDELYRVSKNQIIWGANYFQMPPTKCFVIWHKPQMSEAVSFSMCEYAWTSFDTTSKIISRYMTDKNRIHPTQKPVALYKWLPKNYAKQGDKILDTHMGSGSSIIACIDMGFDYMAFEIDKDYFDMANERIEAHKAQGNLFREEREVKPIEGIDLFAKL